MHQDFVRTILSCGDGVLLVLAMINIHVVLIRHWGAAAARRWGLALLGVGAVAGAVGNATGLPFGPFHYASNAGPTLFDVLPMAIPMLWYVTVSTALLLARIYLPWVSATQEALAVATGVAIFDFALEPYAGWVRHYWHWTTLSAPIQNYIAWWAISYLAVRLLAPTLGMRWEREWRPVIITCGLAIVLVAGRIAAGV